MAEPICDTMTVNVRVDVNCLPFVEALGRRAKDHAKRSLYFLQGLEEKVKSYLSGPEEWHGEGFPDEIRDALDGLGREIKGLEATRALADFISREIRIEVARQERTP